MLTLADVSALLIRDDADSFISYHTNVTQPYLTVAADNLVAVCQFLRNDERLFFDLLACITAIDNGPDANTMEVIYNLTSIPYERNLGLKVMVPREKPVVPSVAQVWRTADWHEREAFDLVGIEFINHPDLRRILLPTDWVGHPLRVDYQEMTEYHGIRTT